MDEDLEILMLRPDMTALELLFIFGSEERKNKVSTVVYYMMLLLKYDLIKLRQRHADGENSRAQKERV